MALLRYIFSILLIISSSTAQGRTILSHHEKLSQKEKQGTTAIISSLIIGSRPPKCEKRCASCEHCEAVQVPIGSKKVAGFHFLHRSAFANWRDEDISNYKPMNWKCKCGSRILNP